MTRQVVDNCFAVADLWRAPWRPSGQNASNLIEQVVEEFRLKAASYGVPLLRVDWSLLLHAETRNAFQPSKVALLV